MYHKILVPVDVRRSEFCEPAIAAAAEIARRDKADVTLMTVQRFVSGALDDSPDFKAFVDARCGAHGIAFKGSVRAGEFVGRTVAACAQEGGFDLIVMTSHDPTALDVLLGSHAASTVLHAPCSVLIVRPG